MSTSREGGVFLGRSGRSRSPARMDPGGSEYYRSRSLFRPSRSSGRRAPRWNHSDVEMGEGSGPGNNGSELAEGEIPNSHPDVGSFDNGVPLPPVETVDNMIERENNAFLQRHHGYNTAGAQYWRGVRILGEGGFGKAGLWIKYDPTNYKIVDRMVIKEAKPEGRLWNSPDLWWYDRSTINGYVIPREAKIQQYCQDPGIVRVRDYKVNVFQRNYRVYMDFAGYEDLYNIWLKQKQYKSEWVREGFQWKRLESEAVPFPEPFLWYVLTQLASAACEMAAPPALITDPNNDKVPNPQIIHHDIKPGNVFLAPPNPKYFPAYPVAQLGDFGGARVTFDRDPTNCKEWNDAHTPRYDPPEMHEAFLAQGFPEEIPARHTHKTNIWQIGETVRTLMTLRKPDRIYWLFGLTKPDMDTSMATKYSDDLLYIVGECVEPFPEDRPTPQALHTYCLTNAPKHTQGMDREDALVDDNSKAYLLRDGATSQDTYRVGMSYQPQGNTLFQASEDAGAIGYATEENPEGDRPVQTTQLAGATGDTTEENESWMYA